MPPVSALAKGEEVYQDDRRQQGSHQDEPGEAGALAGPHDSAAVGQWAFNQRAATAGGFRARRARTTGCPCQLGSAAASSARPCSASPLM